MAVEYELGEIRGLEERIQNHGVWQLDEDDWLLFALITDSVFAAELLWSDPKNHEYSGRYRVRDYQYPLWRTTATYAGFACARATGKTESMKGDAFTHAFKRIGENMLVTAPELIHLHPLTDAIEDRIRDTRLTREFLDTRGGQTGFTHRPFGVNFLDGTKIVGRIPRLTGTGVKGQHQPDLRVEEAQDYPERGWNEVHETVNKDHVNRDGEADFTYWFYGVHSGARDSGFFKRINKGNFKLVTVTKLQTPSWNKAEKDAAIAAYGGSNSPDYRRNILGEAGAAANPFFVMSRLMACVDQDRESEYNTQVFKKQTIRAEDIEEYGDIEMSDLLDLPTSFGPVHNGADIGLTISPTVIIVISKEKEKGRDRLKVIRCYVLERLRPKQIRKVNYALAYHFGKKLTTYGMDETGLGLPMYQEMEDDEAAPQHLLNVSRGYFFNAQVPVSVEKGEIVTDARGQMRDRYGTAVKEEEDPITGEMRLVTYMSMLESSTRYVRRWIDDGELLLPFDPDIVGDFQGETTQRVKTVGSRVGTRNKGNAFHYLDAFRAAAQAENSTEVEAEMREEAEPVMDLVG